MTLHENYPGPSKYSRSRAFISSQSHVVSRRHPSKYPITTYIVPPLSPREKSKLTDRMYPNTGGQKMVPWATGYYRYKVPDSSIYAEMAK